MNQKDAKAAGALFYTMPDELTQDQVDPLLWPAIQRINASGWVWTAESCQGHPDDTDGLPWGFNTSPMLRLVVPSARLGDMLAALMQSAPDPADTLKSHVLKIVPHPLRDASWFSVVAYVEAFTVYQRNCGICVFERFAERLAFPTDAQR